MARALARLALGAAASMASPGACPVTRQPFGWFDRGLEHVRSHRELEGAAAGPGVRGNGEANRIVAFGVARF